MKNLPGENAYRQQIRLLTTKEAADLLGKPVSWMNHEAGRLGIPRYKIGNQWRYRHSELDQWIDRQVAG